jgi:hypothetical protein
LTPEQDKLWPAFVTSVRDAATARAEARKAWRDEREGAERPSPGAMMSHMSENLAKASKDLKKVADAAKPLYDSFDDGQKRQFGPLVHMLREERRARGDFTLWRPVQLGPEAAPQGTSARRKGDVFLSARTGQIYES